MLAAATKLIPGLLVRWRPAIQNHRIQAAQGVGPVEPASLSEEASTGL